MNETLPFDQYQAKYCGLRGPAWRTDLLSELDLRFEPHELGITDLELVELTQFQRLSIQGEAGRVEARKAFPLIAAAYDLNFEESKCRIAKILTLGRCECDEISKRLEVPEEVVKKWEALFFDVREGFDATGWILFRIIQPAVEKCDYEFASELKAAYSGGPVTARGIIDLRNRTPVTIGEKLFDRRLQLDMKLDQAAETPLKTDRERIAFLKTSAQVQLQEARLKLAEKKFAQKCQEARDRHEENTIKIELSQYRDSERETVRIRNKLQREAEKTKRQQAIHDLAKMRQRQYEEDQKAAAARAAASPLNSLRWKSAKSEVSPLFSAIDIKERPDVEFALPEVEFSEVSGMLYTEELFCEVA